MYGDMTYLILHGRLSTSSQDEEHQSMEQFTCCNLKQNEVHANDCKEFQL